MLRRCRQMRRQQQEVDRVADEDGDELLKQAAGHVACDIARAGYDARRKLSAIGRQLSVEA
jgi:hypothetical protein